MKKRIEAALNKEIHNILTASNYEVVKTSMVKLISLADAFDSSGDQKHANHIDQIVKEAAGFWDAFLGGLGGAATTKDSGGTSILDALKGGHLGQFFNKDVLVRIITRFLAGAMTGLIADELVEVITQKVPVLKWFGNSTFIKAAVESAVSYAVLNSDFVSKLVDGVIAQIEEAVGIAKPSIPAQQPLPQQQQNNTPPMATQTPNQPQPTNTANFSVSSGFKNE